MKIKPYILFLLFLFITNTGYSSTGCVINSTARLLPNYTGTTKLGYKIYEKTGELNGYSTYCYYNTNVLCAMRTLVASECSGCYKEAGDPYYYALGEEWVYYTSPALCPVPLDDYIYVLSIAVVGVAFYRLRVQIGL